MKKLIEKDNSLREKEESIFNHSRENKNLRSDIDNMEEVSNNYKKEIEAIAVRRKELETVNSELKTQLCENSIVIRQVSSELDSSHWEISALNKNIEIFRKNEDAFRAENNHLKDIIMNVEQ